MEFQTTEIASLQFLLYISKWIPLEFSIFDRQESLVLTMSHSISSNDDEFGDIVLFPLTFSDDEEEQEDLTESSNDASDERESENEVEEIKPKAHMTLRQRRLSKSYAPLANLKLKVKPGQSRAQNHWIMAIKKARDLSDPWASFHIEDIKTEFCIRHRYNPHKKTWTKDEVQVKMMKKVSFITLP